MAATKRINKKEPLIFIRDCLPQMIAGKYTVSSDIEIQGIAKDSLAQSQREFYVGGPRFNLDSEDIYDFYPPKDHRGFLESTLPHIVFKRRTLPWERTIDGNPHDLDSDKHLPWMALLLLNEDEIKENEVEVKTRSIADLLSPEGDISGPQIKMEIDPVSLMPWEKVNDKPADIKCHTIDISSDLFKIISPKLDDLPYLAHVRKVEVDPNKEQANNDDDGFFSVIIGNRLPTEKENTDVRNSVFLVSLEGFYKYLNNPALLTTSKVRLVVLKHWGFNVAEGNNFQELCDGLSSGPLKMNYGETNLPPTLKNAYEYGYTALKHSQRSGGKSISWYRGPLNPNFLPTEPKTRTFASADQALRYDNTSGLLDVTYAAAWQLGKLMALGDKEFTSELHRWKLKYKQNARKAKFHKELNQLLPGFTPNGDEKQYEEIVNNFLRAKYDPASTAPNNPKKYKVQNVHEETDWTSTESEPPPVPPMVSNWLGRIFLLHGVPFNYLVAHEKMLEKETLRTFYIDSSWVEALLDGALSIARTTDSQMLLNQVKDGQFLPEDIRDLKKVFEDLGGDVKPGDPLEIPNRISGHITGFLLRSELISGWKGIKVLAKGSAGQWLLPLRLERVEEDILLCIFNGKVTEIIIIQPAENIHFGLEKKRTKWVKKWRRPDGTVDESNKKPISLRNSLKGVINIAGLANNLNLPTSAHFAFQMLESPVVYTLSIND